MYLHLINLLKWIIEKLQKIHDAQLIKTEGEKAPPYIALSPIRNADNAEEYCNALSWAISNTKKNDIKNIALTGPYGSGKSSILKTFISKNKDESLKFLLISLATFKEEVELNSKDKTLTTKNDKLRLIELSILQQILYYQADKKIPDSRFQKIKIFTTKQLLISTIAITILLFSITHLIYPWILLKLIQCTPPEYVSSFIHWLTLLITISGLIILIYKSIRILSGIRISKLNIQNTEISIERNISKSILNNHIDEILYFFNVSEYNIVIFEDLDRFKETEIFTKLREINILINNSKTSNKNVVFIYAVRDDMFKADKERTKFFDFIIPIIPVINPSNSNNKLLDKINTNNYKISEDLIDSVSRFIDDMRLLHNIINEYHIYHQKLDKKLNQNKLLAIVVYKNLFPIDFTDLTFGKGYLFNTLNLSQEYIKKTTNDIRAEIHELKTKIENLYKIKVKDIKEIRNSYLLYAIENIEQFYMFCVDETKKTFAEMAEDKNFDYLLLNNIYYYPRNPSFYTTNQQKINIKFEDLEKKVDPINSYQELLKRTKDFHINHIEEYKKQIQEKENEITNLRYLSIRELIEKSNISLDIENTKQKILVKILIQNGFIDEDYLDYISIFYPGNISREDNQFLLNVKTPIFTTFDYKLSKIENILKKINVLDFSKPYVFNYQITDYIIDKTEFIQYKEKHFLKLSDQSEVSIQYIDSYLNNGKKIKLFVSDIVNYWIGIWDYIEEKTQYTIERKEVYFKLILEYANIQDLIKLYKTQRFKESILSKENLLSLISDQKRLCEVIEKLNIRFTNLDQEYTPKEMIEFIYSGYYYELNPKIVSLLLEYKGAYNKSDFEIKNYFSIINSKCDSLIYNINENINDYIENIYTKIENNNQEPEKEVILLLTNENIIYENKLSIIKQVKTRITQLKNILDVEIKSLLLQEGKIMPKWENMIDYYLADGSTSILPLVPYIEQADNLNELSKTLIPIKEQDSDSEHTIFIQKIVLENSFNDEAYSKIIKSIPFYYNNLNFEELAINKVEILIEHQTILLNKETFQKLKGTKQNLIINLLEKQKQEFLKNLESYEIDSLDLTEILKSNKFSSTEKNLIVEKTNESLVVSNSEVLCQIGQQILKDNSFRITDTVLKSIIVNNKLTIENRIRIFRWKNNQIKIEYFETFLNALEEPYSDITINGKRPLLTETEYNLILATILQERKYISSFDSKDKGIRINTFTK